MASDPTLIRAIGLFLPVTMTGALWLLVQPDRRQAIGILFAALWTMPALVALHLLAQKMGWWQFQATGGLLLGIPVDLLLGWILLWGAIPALLSHRYHLALIVVALLLLDVVAMPWLAPVLILNGNWFTGEGLGLLFCLLPAQWLAQWTTSNIYLPARVTMLMLIFTSCLFGVLPAAIFEFTGAGWRTLFERPLWLNSLWIQLLALPAFVGLSAVQEFAQHGQGTPVPFDPPQRLVTSGIYAYVANPMQLSICIMFVGWGGLLGNIWVAAAGMVGVMYHYSLASWSEDTDLARRFGNQWQQYSDAVRPWRVRTHPWVEPSQPFARLYVADNCVPCSALGKWLRQRKAVGLTLIAAEMHPSRRLSRLTYEPADGSPAEEGVAALARALEHIHIGWALVGCVLRLPLLRTIFQIITDAVGGGPRAVTAMYDS